MRRFVEAPDGRHEYECGPWTIEKLFFVCQYLAQVTEAMVGHPKFSSVNYIDLFASSGVCVVRDEGKQRRYAGSALLAAGCRKPFDNLFLVEKDEKKIQDLAARIERLDTTSKVLKWNDDANQVADEVSQAIPPRSLNVAFVDPHSLDMHFASIKRLAERRPLDLLVLFADAMDITRNVETYYYPQVRSKLDEFLGADSDWRKKWDALQNREAGKVRELFAKIYLDQLAALGYRHTRMRPISTQKGPIYRLIFASKDPLGLKFWDIAESEDLGGDRTLWGV